MHSSHSMEDEIFDLEQVMSMDDSFCVNDDDVLKILKTWRLTGGNEGVGPQIQQSALLQSTPSKFIDSRTFTRPKKKLLQQEFHLQTQAQNDASSSPNFSTSGAGINLQIGGLLSTPMNMQRSLINDVSPPSSLASSSMSFNDCGNSLITSGDFSNISCLLNNQDDNLMRGGMSFGVKQTGNLTIINNSGSERKFSSNLSEFEDSKDNHISKTDMHGIEEHSSGNSTLQNSMELDKISSDTFTNDTFKLEAGNATFDRSNGLVMNKTFLDVGGKGNTTFVKADSPSIDSSPDKVCDRTITFKNTPPSSQSQEKDFVSPVTKDIRQLPIMSTPSTHSIQGQKFSGSIEVEDLSPITVHPASIRRKSRLTVEQDDDNKRMSLQNFEDVEKSISLLENTRDEEGFDIILEDITDLKRSLDANEKFKQSLQNIKNRHSQANLEKQQEEMIKRRMDLNGTITVDNKFSESMNKSMSSSNGSERLLNRRSRLDDDMVLPNVDQVNAESPKPTPMPGQGNPNRKADRDRFKTMRIVKKHITGMVVVNDEENMEANEPDVDDNEPEIGTTTDTTFIQQPVDDDPAFKKPEIPQKSSGLLAFRARSLSKPKVYSGLYSNKKDTMTLQLVGKASSIDHLDSNRVDSQENINTTITVNSGKHDGTSLPRTSKMKSPMGTKSKSYHSLVFGNPTLGSQTTTTRAPSLGGRYVSRYGQGPLKTPTGSDQSVKASVNSQAFTKQGIKQPVGGLRQVKSSGYVRSFGTINDNNNLSKDVPRSTSSLLKPTGTKLSVVRPSSGYQGYNNINASNNNYRNIPSRGNDSDPESGRYSPNSLSSSSASSRGSLYPPESLQSQVPLNKIQNSIEDISTNDTGVKQMGSRMIRPSGLKPPSAVRSGLPRPTNFIKR